MDCFTSFAMTVWVCWGEGEPSIPVLLERHTDLESNEVHGEPPVPVRLELHTDHEPGSLVVANLVESSVAVR